MKKYYFLAGLPRSGNTLLSSILNQNKSISVSANSPVSEIMFNLEESKKYDLGFKNFPDFKSYDNIIKNILPSYYENWNSSYIIDRSGAWGAPDNLNLLKKYCPNEIKIIVLIRDVIEVLASFIKWSQENPNNFIDRDYKTIEDQCDFLMSPHGQIIKGMLSFINLKKENPSYSIFIDYSDLVSNCENQIEKIYKFLNIPQYNHYYNNFEKFSTNNLSYDDADFGKNLHTIRTDHIERNKYSVSDILPKKVIEKYSDFNNIIFGNNSYGLY